MKGIPADHDRRFEQGETRWTRPVVEPVRRRCAGCRAALHETYHHVRQFCLLCERARGLVFIDGSRGGKGNRSPRVVKLGGGE